MSKDHFKWDDMRLLLAIARSGQLSAAGRKLSVDAATLSRRIAALESTLGEELFYKSPRGYALTHAGEALLPHAQSMETAALAVADAINPHHAGQLQGTVRLGAPDGVAASLLAPCCAQMAADHPNLRLELVAMARHFSVSQREADLVVAVEQPSNNRLRSRRIGGYKLHLYASKKLLKQRQPLLPSDLKNLPAIGYVPDVLFAPQLDYNAQLSPPLVARLTSSNIIVQLNWTLAGAGVCVLPDFLAKSHPELQMFLEDEVEFTRALYLVRHGDDTRFKAIGDVIIEDLRQRIASDT